MLAIAAIIAAIVVRKEPRALLWVAGLSAAYGASYVWWSLGFPHGFVFAFLCDAVLCLSVYGMYRRGWERSLWLVFFMAATVNLVYMLGLSTNFYSYALYLEALNYLALLIIGGHGVLDGRGADRWHYPSGGLRGYLARLDVAFPKNEQEG